MIDRPLELQAQRLELSAGQLVSSLLAGGRRSVYRGRGMEFDEVREYSAGDDVRMIDWNVTSRMGSAFTKVFREERELNLVLLVDLSASVLQGAAGQHLTVARIVAILALAAERAGDSVSAYLFTERLERWLPARRGRAHVLRLINDVVGIVPHGRGSDLGLALRTVFGLLHRRATCVVISDFRSAGFWPQLTTLRRRHEVLAIRVGGPHDGGFPRTGGVELQDPESGRVIYAAGASRRFRRSYREYWENHFRGLRDGCRRSRVELLEIADGDDPGAALAAFLRRRRAGRAAPRRA